MHTLINSCLIPSGRCMRLLTLGLAGRERDGEAAPGAATPLILRIAGTNTEIQPAEGLGGLGTFAAIPSHVSVPCCSSRRSLQLTGCASPVGCLPPVHPNASRLDVIPPPQLCQKAMGEQTAPNTTPKPRGLSGGDPRRWQQCRGQQAAAPQSPPRGCSRSQARCKTRLTFFRETPRLTG